MKKIFHVLTSYSIFGIVTCYHNPWGKSDHLLGIGVKKEMAGPGASPT